MSLLFEMIAYYHCQSWKRRVQEHRFNCFHSLSVNLLVQPLSLSFHGLLYSFHGLIDISLVEAIYHFKRSDEGDWRRL